ncbi:MAG: PBECR4 domain-containing protein [Oscillospiraceae bacterium]|nr:PBECR4 domain-containing protein [Oscillospiraceae bacterium]
MKKDEAIKILTTCAGQYNKNLANKNVLYIFSGNGKISYFESLFLPRHYLHLTGIEIVSENIKSVDFYRLCLKSKLSSSAFTFHKNGTTEMKLSVLPQVMNIHRSAKMIGDYDNKKSILYTEKIIGTITACVGFVRDDRYYLPNTTLREDIRTITLKPQKRILAIFTKGDKDKRYYNCSYLAKRVSLESIAISDELKQLISL